MITFALFSALSAFYFTMFFTPGPNNAMLTEFLQNGKLLKYKRPGSRETWIATPGQIEQMKLEPSALIPLFEIKKAAFSCDL